MSAARNHPLRAFLKLFLRYFHATAMYAHQHLAAPLPFILPAVPRGCSYFVAWWEVSNCSFDVSEDRKYNRDGVQHIIQLIFRRLPDA